MEVWIETVDACHLLKCRQVTSHVEVWIETILLTWLVQYYKSPPTWRCGLKLVVCVCAHIRTQTVTSHVEVWIETFSRTSKAFAWKSPPTWRCGLKQRMRNN